MNFNSLVVVIGIAVAVVMMDAKLAEARGFGFRGGATARIGVGGSRNPRVRYYGPGFYAGPRTYGPPRQGSTQFQQRPWYYSRSGPYEYYRPYNPLYRVR